MNKNKKYFKLAIFLIIMDIFTLTGFILSYGPWDYLRNLLVTTAMTTKEHKYLAHILYTDEMIKDIMNNNYVKDNGLSTDASEITIGQIEEKTTYDSIYEEQILKRDPEHEDYKIIEVSGSGYKGFIGVIYDPSRVSLLLAPKFGQTGEFLQTMAKDAGAKLAINASGFIDINERGDGGQPTGTIIKDGKIVWTGKETGYSGGIAGFNKDNVLVLTHSTAEEAVNSGIRDAVEFGPFLIVNGVPAIIKGNGGWGTAPRTVLAQRKDGIVLFVIIDGRQPGYSVGINMPDLVELLLKYKAYNAVNLDGGASSSLVENGEIVNKPCAVSVTGERLIPNGWIFK